MDLLESAISKNSTARHPWEKARSNVILDLLKEIVPDNQSNLEILDIGCGDSWLIEKLSKKYKNSHFTAVDSAFTSDIISDYNQRLNSDQFSFHQSVEEALKPKKQIDLVLLLDVIEHIEDEVQFLEELIESNPSINKNTSFLITVPAFQSLFSAHDEFLGHYRRYTNYSLKERLSKSGLELEKTGYFFSSLLLPRAIIKLIETIGIKGKNAKGIGGHKEGSLDPLIESVLILDYRLAKVFRSIGLNLAGLSNFAIARPKS